MARFSLLEALRAGLAWAALSALALCLLLGAFLSQVAITESDATFTAITGALLRGCAAFLVAAHVVGSVTREFNDKGVELALALPISRPAWYAGKLLGFTLAGACMASLFAAPLLAAAPAPAVISWWISLSFELALVAAAALFVSSTLMQGMLSLAVVAGFYLLSRALPAIQAIAAGPAGTAAADATAANHAARWMVDALALFLPRLDSAANADWLVYGAPSAPLQMQSLASLALYFLLLGAAGLFDFSRRNF